MGLVSRSPTAPTNCDANGRVQLSLNVGRRNKWILPECEAPDAKGDCDERHYANALSSLIKNDWDVRFIIDQSRSGVPPKLGADLQHTCNIKGAGFGNFPGSATNDPLADSFVWAKRMPPSFFKPLNLTPPNSRRPIRWNER